MKKVILMLVLVCFLALSLTACFGKFALTRTVYDIHSGIGGNDFTGKIIRSLLLIFGGEAVYGFCAFADAVVFNTWESLTGSNPIAMNDGEMEIQYATSDEGKEYEIITTKNRYDIREVGNPSHAIAFVWEGEESAWYLQSGDASYKIVEDSDDTTRYFNPEGKAVVTVFK